MERNRKKQVISGRWTSKESIKLIQHMRDFQLLWIPGISRKTKYRDAIQVGMKRIAALTDRPWKFIQQKLYNFRYKYKQCSAGKLEWNYYREMKRSLTNGDELLDFDQISRKTYRRLAKQITKVESSKSINDDTNYNENLGLKRWPSISNDSVQRSSSSAATAVEVLVSDDKALMEHNAGRNQIIKVERLEKHYLNISGKGPFLFHVDSDEETGTTKNVNRAPNVKVEPTDFDAMDQQQVPKNDVAIENGSNKRLETKDARNEVDRPQADEAQKKTSNNAIPEHETPQAADLNIKRESFAMDIDDIQPNNIQLPDPVASEQRSTETECSRQVSAIGPTNINVPKTESESIDMQNTLNRQIITNANKDTILSSAHTLPSTSSNDTKAAISTADHFNIGGNLWRKDASGFILAEAEEPHNLTKIELRYIVKNKPISEVVCIDDDDDTKPTNIGHSIGNNAPQPTDDRATVNQQNIPPNPITDLLKDHIRIVEAESTTEMKNRGLKTSQSSGRLPLVGTNTSLEVNLGGETSVINPTTVDVKNVADSGSIDSKSASKVNSITMSEDFSGSAEIFRCILNQMAKKHGSKIASETAENAISYATRIYSNYK